MTDYQAAIDAKAHMTWNLHHASSPPLGRSLDFFTLLLSLSSGVRGKGQENYAAAGTRYRRALSLRACVLDLGVI
ncbi:hypothetical protein F4819DRAFT_448310 [Hypoxylon fuscum]|nr:hypothetical protein F4819DRAFT_448310 [Hypoxylon fuscum]